MSGLGGSRGGGNNGRGRGGGSGSGRGRGGWGGEGVRGGYFGDNQGTRWNRVQGQGNGEPTAEVTPVDRSQRYVPGAPPRPQKGTRGISSAVVNSQPSAPLIHQDAQPSPPSVGVHQIAAVAQTSTPATLVANPVVKNQQPSRAPAAPMAPSHRTQTSTTRSSQVPATQQPNRNSPMTLGNKMATVQARSSITSTRGTTTPNSNTVVPVGAKVAPVAAPVVRNQQRPQTQAGSSLPSISGTTRPNTIVPVGANVVPVIRNQQASQTRVGGQQTAPITGMSGTAPTNTGAPLTTSSAHANVASTTQRSYAAAATTIQVPRGRPQQARKVPPTSTPATRPQQANSGSAKVNGTSQTQKVPTSRPNANATRRTQQNGLPSARPPPNGPNLVSQTTEATSSAAVQSTRPIQKTSSSSADVRASLDVKPPSSTTSLVANGQQVSVTAAGGASTAQISVEFSAKPTTQAQVKVSPVVRTQSADAVLVSTTANDAGSNTVADSGSHSVVNNSPVEAVAAITPITTSSQPGVPTTSTKENNQQQQQQPQQQQHSQLPHHPHFQQKPHPDINAKTHRKAARADMRKQLEIDTTAVAAAASSGVPSATPLGDASSPEKRDSAASVSGRKRDVLGGDGGDGTSTDRPVSVGVPVESKLEMEKGVGDGGLKESDAMTGGAMRVITALGNVNGAGEPITVEAEKVGEGGVKDDGESPSVGTSANSTITTSLEQPQQQRVYSQEKAFVPATYMPPPVVYNHIPTGGKFEAPAGHVCNCKHTHLPTGQASFGVPLNMFPGLAFCRFYLPLHPVFMPRVVYYPDPSRGRCDAYVGNYLAKVNCDEIKIGEFDQKGYCQDEWIETLLVIEILNSLGRKHDLLFIYDLPSCYEPPRGTILRAAYVDLALVTLDRE
ncbi:hypothetical protein HDU76_003382 [Blyttiomyces sp. JEL0837]|nr:hypothetical protein HDU76_003382 [Blyttiomyces sp. JEL0837]